jgi:hypothetical protein
LGQKGERNGQRENDNLQHGNLLFESDARRDRF